MIQRKARFNGHELFNDVVRSDWMAAISMSPDAFQASLYLPDDKATEADLDESYESEEAAVIDTNQDSLNYYDPLVVWVLDCPDEQESFFALDENGENLGEMGSDEPLLLRIARDDVPVGSVLEWDEETGEGLRTVWWYVQRLIGYGTSNVGTLYACVPMRDFNSEDTTEDISANISNDTSSNIEGDTSGDLTPDTTSDSNVDTSNDISNDSEYENSEVTYL